jgi:hypothetical protein
MIPVFEEHPTLLSLRATFQSKAIAEADFVSAAPRTLMALGFINIESAQVLALLLQRCQLQHLWFAAESPNWPFLFRLDGVNDWTATIKEGLSRVKTLSLPSRMSEDACASIIAHCPMVEIVCRMRITTPAFGAGSLAHKFEPLEESGGVAIRRRGSCAQLVSNLALWRPYVQDDTDIITSRCKNGGYAKKITTQARPKESADAADHRRGVRQRRLEQDYMAIARELAEAVARRRSSSV